MRLSFSAKWWEGLQGGERAAGSCGMIGEVFEEWREGRRGWRGAGEGWGWLGWRSPPWVRLIFSAKWWEGLQGGEKAAGSCGMIGEVFEEWRRGLRGLGRAGAEAWAGR